MTASREVATKHIRRHSNVTSRKMAECLSRRTGRGVGYPEVKYAGTVKGIGFQRWNRAAQWSN